MLTEPQLLALAQSAPGSMWAYDYLVLAIQSYDRRDENAYATVRKASQLCGHEGEPCIYWARTRAANYNPAAFAQPTPQDHQQ